MTKTFIRITVLAVVIGLAVSVQSGAQDSEVVPAKISKDEFAGKIFDRPDTKKQTNGGNTTLSATSFTNSDENFSTGVWRTGKLQFEQSEPWGVDEFLYIIDGSLTVTSSDGTVQVISAGEAITIPKNGPEGGIPKALLRSGLFTPRMVRACRNQTNQGRGAI